MSDLACPICGYLHGGVDTAHHCRPLTFAERVNLESVEKRQADLERRAREEGIAEGRRQAFAEAAEIARDTARVLRTNMDAFDPNAANQCDVLADLIEAAAKGGKG